MSHRVWLAGLVLVLAMLACGSGSASPKTAADYMTEYGGKTEVYERILALDDCPALQGEFDQAEANLGLQEPGTPQYKWGLGYMQASLDRMQALQCDASSQSSGAPTQLSTVTQALAASSPTIFVLPTLTQPPTLIVVETALPAATSTLNLSTVGPAPTLIYVFPTNTRTSGGGGGSGVCPCSGDTLNCGDFSFQSSAQACMNYCISMGAGDIHNLDGNADGRACESLP